MAAVCSVRLERHQIQARPTERIAQAEPYVRSRLDRAKSNDVWPIDLCRGGMSTAERGLTRLKSAMPNFSLRGPWEAVSSDTTRPIGNSMRVVDRRSGGRRIESLDGDLFERRWQQSLNV